MIGVLLFINNVSIFAQISEKNFLKEEVLLLQKLIQIESYSNHEHEVSDILIQFCKSKGLYVQEFRPDPQSVHFCASIFPLSERKPNILFTSHLDVVSAYEDNYWRFSPFSGHIQDDTLWGRGSIDCKGLAVMQLFALVQMKDSILKSNSKYNYSFIGMIGEENSSPNGAKWLVNTYLSELQPVVVLGEGGSGMNQLVPSKPELEVFGVSVAEKSSLWIRLEVKNKSQGHGAVPPDLYANKRLLKALISLLNQKKKIKFTKVSKKMFKDFGEMEGGLKGFVIKHINWTIFWPFVKKYFRDGEIFNVLVNDTFVISEMGSLNVGSTNQISQGAFAVLDCRLLPEADKKKFLRKVQFAVGLKVNVSVISESPNTAASPITNFYYSLEKAIKKTFPESLVSPILFPASTDNNFFRAKGVPTYGLVPVVLSRAAIESIHGSNEYLTLKQLEQGINVYKEFIKENL